MDRGTSECTNNYDMLLKVQGHMPTRTVYDTEGGTVASWLVQSSPDRVVHV